MRVFVVVVVALAVLLPVNEAVVRLLHRAREPSANMKAAAKCTDADALAKALFANPDKQTEATTFLKTIKEWNAESLEKACKDDAAAAPPAQSGASATAAPATADAAAAPKKEDAAKKDDKDKSKDKSKDKKKDDKDANKGKKLVCAAIDKAPVPENCPAKVSKKADAAGGSKTTPADAAAAPAGDKGKDKEKVKSAQKGAQKGKAAEDDEDADIEAEHHNSDAALSANAQA